MAKSLLANNRKYPKIDVSAVEYDFSSFCFDIRDSKYHF